MIFSDRYINPLTDFGFKKLFGTEPNKALLIDFLNQLLPDKHKIEDLTYAQNEHLGKSILDRKAIFDLYCVSTTGERFIVEIQKAKQNYFKDRSAFYASFPIQEQARRGEWNYQLSPVYLIGILDFVFDDHDNDPELIHIVQLKDQHCRVFYDKLKLIYVELPRFDKQEHELESQFDKWLFVLKHLANLQDRPVTLQEKVFQQLFEAAEIARFSPKEQEVYEESLKYYRDLNNVVDTSRQEGREEGFEQGIQQGMQQGLEEGRQTERKLIGMQLKKQGLSSEVIAAATELTSEEIAAL